ncbi:MAG: site-specific DNA-methyltransferase [Thermoguttaceae bacterium]|nr:site-specific DNA-methyltransferase [Thermoguttaceae bacterium]
MPTLEWLCKDKVVNHHLDVPYRILERKYSFDAAGTRAEDVGSENMIVHGDNLEALKALLPRYEGRVKCVYIDPPYNTGNENWVYNDNVNAPRIRKWLGQVVGKEGEDLSRHDKWLCMTYPRLRLLHKLLADDGAIFVSIDDNELLNLRSIMNEIFGAANFIAQITLLCNPKGRSQDKYFATNHEYLLVYTKSPLPAGCFSVAKSVAKIEKDYKYSDDAGKYRLQELRNTHREFNRTTRPNLWYPLYADPRDGSISLTQDATHSIEIFPFWPDGYEGCWTWGRDKSEQDLRLLLAQKKSGVWKAYRKNYANTEQGEAVRQKLFTIWNNRLFYTEKGQAAFGQIFQGADKTDFPQPKSVEFITEILRAFTRADDIILDSFAGSGTTAHAVLNLNKADGGKRRFILVEMEDYADSITAERVKRVIQGYPTKEEKTLYDEEITPKNLASGAELLERAKAAAQEAKDSELYEKVSNPKIEGGRLQVVATLKAEVSAQGTGGDFSFYELGAPLLVDERLNPSAPLEKIREYIWFTETKTPFSPVADENEYYLGTFNDAAYYFYYKSDETTTLDAAFLASVKSKSDLTIVYADRCAVDAKKLKRLGVVFKKIPRDINGR